VPGAEARVANHYKARFAVTVQDFSQVRAVHPRPLANSRTPISRQRFLVASNTLGSFKNTIDESLEK
jgi:hypothetical protein